MDLTCLGVCQHAKPSIVTAMCVKLGWMLLIVQVPASVFANAIIACPLMAMLALARQVVGASGSRQDSKDNVIILILILIHPLYHDFAGITERL